MAPGRYLYAGLATIINIVLNALTGGHFLWLEGRVRRDVFYNWLHRYRYRPPHFARPQTEAELVALVRNASGGIRVFGSGHSFNSGVVADETLISLDRYSGVLWKDRKKKQIAFRAGTRIRDVNRALLEEGWAFAALPSHDAQSIGGIISTDVHGTGRDWGFVSEAVAAIKLLDGRGELIECLPEDDLYKAAIGGVGAVGIIVEVVVQAVDAFRVQQATEIWARKDVEANLDRLLEENEHFSLYIFPFGDLCQINTWNRTLARRSPLGSAREFINYSVDAILSAWVADALAHLRILPRLSNAMLRVIRNTNLVLESGEAFNRTVYYPHHELEFTVPYEATIPTLNLFLALYEEHYARHMPFFAIEVRFTPGGHDRTLIGAGKEQRSAWLNLLCNDSGLHETFLKLAEQEVKAIGGRPHLGKYCETVDRAYMEAVHGEAFSRFRELVHKHDPQGRFVNDFTRRLFEPGAA